MRRLLYLLVILWGWAATATVGLAQEDDKGFLTRTLQNALSGAGREVSIDGFQGALSSSASFDRMTIADKDGVWLSLQNVKLVWTRSALLRGQLEVESLTADQLDIPRLPVAENEGMPDAEAAPFRLPDLPVAINIATFSIRQINLGAPVLGEAAQLGVKASARYSEAVANIDIDATRTDGKQGAFAVKANLDRTDDLLDLLVHLTEDQQGIVSRLLTLPGQPSLELSVNGSGPLDDFRSDLRLATDGKERLAGVITLGAQTPRRPSGTPDRRIQADIGGDITALFAPRYRAFFGDDVRLKMDALREADGAFEVTDFAFSARAAELQGQLALGADNWPRAIDITGTIASPDGTSVLLPVSNEATTAERVELSVKFDAADGEALRAEFDVQAFAASGVEVERLRLALDGALRLTAAQAGEFLGNVAFDANGLALRDPALAQAVGSQLAGKARVDFIAGSPIKITGLALKGTDYGLAGDLVIDSLETGFATTLDVALTASDLSRYAALAGQEIDGQSALDIKGRVVPLSGEFDLDAQGSTDDLKIGIAQADAVLAGRTELSLTARRGETGTFVRDLVLNNPALNLTGTAELRSSNSRVEAEAELRDVSLVLPQYSGPVTVSGIATQDTRGWTVDARTNGPYEAALTAKGLATGPEASLVFTADVPQLARFVDQIDGRLQADGRLWRAGTGWKLDALANGPYRTQAKVTGQVTPTLEVEFDVSAPDIGPLVPQVRGPVQASGRLRQTEEGFHVDTSARGPYGARADIKGLATGPDMRLAFDMSIPDLRPLVPGAPGALAAEGVIRQTAQGLALQTTARGPFSSRISAEGVVTGPQAAVDFRLALPNVSALVDKVSGPLEVTGKARKQPNGWRLDTAAQGPSGTQATLAGTVRSDGTLALDLAGTAPLGLSRPFIAPRNLQGQAQFDLSVNGPAALSSVSGSIRASGATLSAPTLRVALRDIAADVRIARNRAQLDVTAQATNGGDLRVGGAVTLTPSLPADIQIAARDIVLIDPRLYRTTLNGDIRLAGPLAGGAQISGQINVGETEVSVPSTGLTSIGDIPPITHIGAAPQVTETRRKAGLTEAQNGSDPTGQTGGPGFGLNVRVSAPGRIFVRGRGLDAELGGTLRVTGSTNNMVSSGHFELLRGRLDILGKRLDLVEGTADFQGDLIPYIRFVSSTTTSTGEVRVIVAGPADAPVVTFEATPDAPQDEVLAQLLFGRRISDISAFQALQLANAVATLAGRGGAGVISNLREGFGLDDLDVTTSDNGATSVSIGKYLSDNVYTDVTASSDGTGEVSLNLDLTPNLKAKGTLGSDGNSGLGIFFEKDY